MIHRALIPAAGFGTRFLPATKAAAKELLAVVDKPMIQYAVEEAVAAGASRVGFVVSGRKTGIEDYFRRDPELETLLTSRGRAAELDSWRRLVAAADFSYIRQPEPLGLGHAVLMGEEFAAGGPFGVLNPDTIYAGPKPCLKQLSEVFDAVGTTTVVLGRIRREDAPKYGVVRAEPAGGRMYKILDLVEKPRVEEAPSDLAVLGRYIFKPSIFDCIRRTPPGRGGEIQITDAIRLLLTTESVYGVLFEGERYDAGDKLGFLQAQIGLALRRPEFKGRMKEWLKQISEENRED